MDSNIDKLILKTPASWYGDKSMDALPIGNGKTGALIYGAIRSESILINRYNLWHCGTTAELPDVSDTLAKARSLMDIGDFKKANALTTDELIKQGYNTCPACPFTLCNLKIVFPSNKEFKHYRRILDMATGEIHISYIQGEVNFRRRTFISRANDTLVYEVSTNGHKIEADIRLEMFNDNSEAFGKKYEQVKESLSIIYDKNYIYFKATNEDGQDYGAVLKHYNDSKMTLLLKTFSNENYKAAFERLKADLDAMSSDYTTLLSEHIPLHSKLYHSASIELSVANSTASNEELLLNAYEEKASATLLQKLWNYGRYLHISGTCDGGLPFPLYGLWHAGYNPPWSQHVANINLQMMYWHTQIGGLNDSVKSVIDYFYDKLDDFKENSAKIFSCEGIVIPVYTAPSSGKMSVIVPVIVNFISCGGWLSHHFHQYYRYSEDKQTLFQKIIPFMLEVAKFYENYIVWDENGQIKIYPSVSPENSPLNFIPENFQEHLGHPFPAVMNATMDFAIMKEFFTSLIELCNEEGLYPDQIPLWGNIIKDIPKYMINPEGDIKEWMHKDLNDHYNHRHLSHLYPVFPGYEITEESSPYLLTAFEMAVDKRELSGQSGWSLTFMANLYARLGNGEKAINCLDTLTRSCLTNSFMTMHNDYRDMGLTLEFDQFQQRQLDANMGLVSAIQEMLFFSSENIIKFLPACPKRFNKGKVHHFHFAKGTVSFEWNFETNEFSAEIHAQQHTKIRVKFPALSNNYYVSTNNIEPFIQKDTYMDIEILQGEIIKIKTI